MKVHISTAVCALALSAGTATALANDAVVISGHTATPYISLDQRATQACVDAFIARLLPGNSVPVRSVVPPGEVPVFSYTTDVVIAPYMLMSVDMTATLVHGNQLLAKSVCKVNRNAKVVNLATRITDPAKLAGLLLQDVRLAMLTR